MGMIDREWYQNHTRGGHPGGSVPFPAHCTCCGHSFQVRVPSDAPKNRQIHLNYRCPRCGQQLSTVIGPASSGGKTAERILRILGIPCMVILGLFFVLAIASVFTDVTPVFRSIDQGFHRFTGSIPGLNTSVLTMQNIMPFMVKLFILLCCMPVHECAHAWTADKLGDNTGRRMGRISLNPFRHLDPWGTAAILLFGIGYAKPVPVNINNFKHRKLDFALTALAGPVSNLLMAVILLFINRGVAYSGNYNQYTALVIQALLYGAMINLSLAVFNMIPVPPLDGSRLLTAVLPDHAYDSILKYERYSMYVLLGLLLLFSLTGYSPISAVTQRVFAGLYRLIMAP